MASVKYSFKQTDIDTLAAIKCPCFKDKDFA